MCEKTFFEFKSTYDHNSDNINKTGLSYSAYVRMIKDDDNFDTEYLVTEKFLVDSLKEKCDMHLVEGNSFYTIYEQQRNFFENIAPKEENKLSKNYFMKVQEFYNMEDSVNKASLEFSKLHKYYIFKKNTSDNKIKKEKVKEVVKTKEKAEKVEKVVKTKEKAEKVVKTKEKVEKVVKTKEKVEKVVKTKEKAEKVVKKGSKKSSKKGGSKKGSNKSKSNRISEHLNTGNTIDI